MENKTSSVRVELVSSTQQITRPQWLEFFRGLKSEILSAEWPDVQGFWQCPKTLPVFIEDEAQEAAEKIKGVIACYRFSDLKIFVNHVKSYDAFKSIIRNIEDFKILMRTLLLHELGHFAFVPEDKAQRLEAMLRMKKCLGKKGGQGKVGHILNIYGDILINNNIYQRFKADGIIDQQHLVEMYVAMTAQHCEEDKLNEFWVMYMKVYEKLWGVDIISDPRFKAQLDPTPKLLDRLKAIVTRSARKAKPKFNLKQIDQDAIAIADLLRDVKPGVCWLDQVEPFTEIIKKYYPDIESLERCEAGEGEGDPQEGEELPQASDIDPKDIEKIIKRHGNKEKSTPMPLDEFKDLMKPLMPPAEAVKAWYNTHARMYSIVPPAVPVFLDGPLVSTYSEEFHIGRDSWDRFRPERMFASGIPRPVPGFNMEKTHQVKGHGVQVKEELPWLDIYVDSSQSMPDPSELPQGSPLALAAIVFAYSALNHNAKARITNFDTRYFPTDDERFHDAQGREHLLDYALHNLDGGTTFPLGLLQKRLLAMKKDVDGGPRKNCRVIVISDSDIMGSSSGYLMHAMLTQPELFAQANVSFELVLNINAAAYRVAHAAEFEKIRAAGVKLDWQFISSWEELKDYSHRSAERTFALVV